MAAIDELDDNIILEDIKNNVTLKDMIPFLKEINCCSRCILIYVGIQPSEGFINDFIHADKKLQTIESEMQTFEPPHKRLKKNICNSCLGILEDTVLEEHASLITKEKLSDYEVSNFKIYATLPKCLSIRIYSIVIYLHEKFPLLINIEYQGKSIEMNIKKVYRMILAEHIVKNVGIPHKPNSDFVFEFTIHYDDDDNEVKDLKSKGMISTFINKHDIKAFQAKYSVPPVVPISKTTAEVTIVTSPMFIGGRYLKFARNIGQTPWFINGKAMTETSVQEIIFTSINKVLGCDYQMIFTASGREDADVRMLGQGRPFYIQITHPKSYNITSDTFREIEEDILRSEKVAVIKMQIIPPVLLLKIKDGEKYKNKRYSAVCHTTAKDLKSVISKINKLDGGLKIYQKTPLRVLHRRTLDVREKMIYSINASVVEDHPNLILLDMVTQAGTYVKEFVNSDFYRTKPSITELIGYPIDIVALDVAEVYLNWP